MSTRRGPGISLRQLRKYGIKISAEFLPFLLFSFFLFFVLNTVTQQPRAGSSSLADRPVVHAGPALLGRALSLRHDRRLSLPRAVLCL